LKLIDLDARVVVASISGYVRHARTVSGVPAVARPSRSVPPPLPAARRPRPARLRVGHCGDGCTFLKRFRSSAPTPVRCPYRAGVVCTVAPA
jgi:hypothetical protein